MRKITLLVFVLLFNLAIHPSFANDSKLEDCPEQGCSECQQIYPDMGKTEFHLKDGKLDGLQKIYHKNGALAQEINYKDGQIDGAMTLYYKDGSLWEKHIYKDDVLLDENNKPKNGPYQRFYQNGKLANEALYKDGLPQGEVENYYEDGTLKMAQDYTDRDHVSLKTFNENGKLKFEGVYFKGQYDGKVAVYSDKGQLQYEMSLKEGVPYGIRKIIWRTEF